MDESGIPRGKHCVVVGGTVTNLILSVHHAALQQNQNVAQQGFTLGTKLGKNRYCCCPHSGILWVQDNHNYYDVNFAKENNNSQLIKYLRKVENHT